MAPKDGVMKDTFCVRTDFSLEEDDRNFKQKNKSKAHISASVELGIMAIRDMETGVMLTIHINDAINLIFEAIEKSKEDNGGCRCG